MTVQLEASIFPVAVVSSSFGPRYKYVTNLYSILKVGLNLSAQRGKLPSNLQVGTSKCRSREYNEWYLDSNNSLHFGLFDF